MFDLNETKEQLADLMAAFWRLREVREQIEDRIDEDKTNELIDIELTVLRIEARLHELVVIPAREGKITSIG